MRQHSVQCVASTYLVVEKLKSHKEWILIIIKSDKQFHEEKLHISMTWMNDEWSWTQ